MKRKLFLCVSFLLGLLATAAYAGAKAAASRVFVNGMPLREQAIVRNDTTYAPPAPSPRRCIARSSGIRKPASNLEHQLPTPTNPKSPTPTSTPTPDPPPPNPPVLIYHDPETVKHTARIAVKGTRPS